MSQQNVEAVERFVAAWNRRDLEAILSLAHPGTVYVNSPAAVEPGTRHGHEGLSIVFDKQWETLGPDARQELDQAHPRDDEVIAVIRISRLMPESSARVENKLALRFVFRDGLVIRLEVLGGGSTFDEALEAEGLSG